MGWMLLLELRIVRRQTATTAPFPFIEFFYDPPEWTPARRDYILPTTLEAEADGWTTLPETPGLEVEIDWAALEQWRIGKGIMEG